MTAKNSPAPASRDGEQKQLWRVSDEISDALLEGDGLFLRKTIAALRCGPLVIRSTEGDWCSVANSGFSGIREVRRKYLVPFESTPSALLPSEHQTVLPPSASVFEVVQDNEEMYWPLGVFLTEAEAMELLEDEEPPHDEDSEDSVTIQIRKRKIGFHPHEYAIIAHRTWVNEYVEGTDESKWVAKPVNLAARHSQGERA